MKRFLRAVCYYLLLTALATLFGARMDRTRFMTRPPRYLRPRRWEQQGNVWRALGIQRWKSRLPDVSRHSRRMVKKALPKKPDAPQVLALILETCVAEHVHVLLCLFGVFGLVLCPTPAGVALFAAWVLIGNLPFILIQRYNRPRLVSLYQKLERPHATGTPQGGAYELSHPHL